jgi:hypothetical protein
MVNDDLDVSCRGFCIPRMGCPGKMFFVMKGDPVPPPVRKEHVAITATEVCDW